MNDTNWVWIWRARPVNWNVTPSFCRDGMESTGETRVAVARKRCREGDNAVIVNRSHGSALALPIRVIILDDTVAVDPNITITEHANDIYRVSKCFGH